MKELPDFLSYCKKENIAFSDGEKAHYDINLQRKNHRMYEHCMKYCFQSEVPEEVEDAFHKLNHIDKFLA